MIAQAASHLFALEDLSWELAVTDGTWKAMRLRVAVRVVLLSKVPSLDGTCETFTDGCSLNIDELADLKVTRAQTVAHRQEVLW